MAKTETGISPPATSGEVGRHLRTVRKAQGLSRTEVARSAGLTRRELASYERGRTPVPDSDLWCLAGSCGVDVGELLPAREQLKVGSDLGSLTVGDSVRRLRASASSDGLLREYLAMIYELRNLAPGTRPPMREEDLAALADALGGTPEVIESRLAELVGASRDEASRLRVMILPPRALPPVPVLGAPSVIPQFGDLNQYGTTPMTSTSPSAAPLPEFDFAMTANTTIGDPNAATRFFDAPRADDPFSSPPAMGGLAPLDMTTAVAPIAAPAGAFDPFAPPNVAPIDPFATPPTGPPLGRVSPLAAMPVDPFPAPMAVPFDPASFDPASFDPASFAGDPFNPPPADEPSPRLDTAPFHASTFDSVPFGSELPLGDPFGVEVVALGPTDPPPAYERTPIDGLADPGAEQDWMANWEALGHGTNGDSPPPGVADADDPWAVLRMPGDGIVADPALDSAYPTDPFGPESVLNGPQGSGFMADLSPDPAAQRDPFADAFEPVGDESPGFEALDAAPVEVAAVSTVTESEGEPADDWFDRAAAATAALVADHQAVRVDDVVVENTVVDALPVDAAVEAAVEPGADDLIDAPADAPIAAPIAGLAPIAWSLHPPVPDAAPETPAPETGTDEVDPTPGSDREFVTAGPDWQVGGIFPATAMADDGTLALRRADVRWALADLVANDDFTVRATVDFTSGAGFGILFRVSSDDSERITGYSFDVDPIYSGGGFLLRQWHDSRQHWKPLAHAPVADSTRLYGHHAIELTLHADLLTASVDGETVLTVRQLSRCSIESGREPCRGGRLGVQAWSTTEVTVDRMMLANL